MNERYLDESIKEYIDSSEIFFETIMELADLNLLGKDFRVILESTKEYERKIMKFAILIMEHSLKVQFSDSNLTDHHWLAEIGAFRKNLVKAMKGDGGKNINTNLMKFAKLHLQDMYEKAIDGYKDDMHDDPSLEGIEDAPEECPWEIEDLLYDSPEEIVDKLWLRRE